MISEKPIWIRHEGMQIFSIDVQPGGLRFATGGGDHKVRIWSTKYIGKDVGFQNLVSQLLATLRDHFGSVNCVRWAKHGRLIASGSDDQVIQIHERKPGSGTAEFGSGEAPDVENWKVAMTLRGHTADVVDLNWSPDDLTLASGSLDNTIHIWDMRNGICTAVLRGHSSLVKGVTWDPIGSFIASQSDDKTVIIWRTSDWSLVHRTDGHWAKSLGSTFFRRLGWSPCGHFVTTTHGFQKPRHSAPVLERGEWSATFDFLGHNAPIIVVKFNHFMFKPTPSNAAQEVNATASVGWTNNNSSKTGGGKESQPYNVIAIGSQDRNITVWTTASARPLCVAKHFFTQSVVDLSWSPDGYSLYACSLDGSVAVFHFKTTEIGQRLTDAELDDLKRKRYGDVRGRQCNLAESPAQLLLEAAAAAKQKAIKQKVAKKPTIDVDALQNRTSLKSLKVSESQIKTMVVPTCDNTLNNNNKVPPLVRASPVKQREIRQPDGRRRIIPESIGVTNQQEHVTDLVQSLAGDFDIINSSSDGRRDSEITVKKALCGMTENKGRIGVTARATISDSLLIEKVPLSSNRHKEDVGINVQQIGGSKSSGIWIRVTDKYVEDQIPICLEAYPREEVVTENFGGACGDLRDETVIYCKRGTQTLWSDRIGGKASVLAGNNNFWAVGCEDGCLQIYTKCGRRSMPTMMMGSAAVFIDCDESWKLLLVTNNGTLYLWDLFMRKCLLHDSLASLLTPDPKSSGRDAGKIKVISAKLSKSGFPLVILATRHAFMYDMNLECWLRVVDDSFPASSFASSLNLGSNHTSELSRLQVDVNKFLSRKPGLIRVSDDEVQTRAHLESQLASSLAMKSSNEYRHSLLSYIRYLVREADESRLREICEDFVGPPIGTAETTTSDLNHPLWDPCVLGMNKHKLLREDILPAMATNRKVQRLINEFIDLLTEHQDTTTTTAAVLTDTTANKPVTGIEAEQKKYSPQEKVEIDIDQIHQIPPRHTDNLHVE